MEWFGIFIIMVIPLLIMGVWLAIVMGPAPGQNAATHYKEVGKTAIMALVVLAFIVGFGVVVSRSGGQDSHSIDEEADYFDGIVCPYDAC
jgi:hypothetical protein